MQYFSRILIIETMCVETEGYYFISNINVLKFQSAGKKMRKIVDIIFQTKNKYGSKI